jgi:CRP-like cAMP-binding protein
MRASQALRVPEQNRLLRALPHAEYEQLLPGLEDVTLRSGEVLFETGERIAYVYFPQHAVVSLLAPVAGGAGVEIAIIGNEGMVGLSVFLGTPTATSQAVSQVPDGVRRLPVAGFLRALSRGTAFRRILLRYADTLLGQIAQCAACNQRHSVAQRCARWFLMAHDRVGADRFLLTQEFLAQMLDVGRPTVSLAARQLHAVGAITYSRGHVTITSRTQLERASCACYAALVRDYARAFSTSTPAPRTERRTVRR